MSHAHVKTLTLEEATIPKGSMWRKFPAIAALIGIAGIAGAFFLSGTDADGTHKQFFYSYLTSFMFWISIALGALFFVLIHHGTRAGWSTVVRRIAENYMITLPLFALLAVPIILGAHDLFEWTHVDLVKEDLVLSAKAPYLNEGFFIIRIIAYMVVLGGLATYLYRLSTKQDITGDIDLTHKARRIAPLGWMLFAIISTLLAIDLMMSLSPHWFSTIYGVYFFAGSFMSALCVIALTAMLLQRSGTLKDAITKEHYHDLGKLTFGFMIFWWYIAFSQFILIWYANIPEETLWYANRIEGGWAWIIGIMSIMHFGVPLFMLMSRHIKRRRASFAFAAVWLLVAHYIDIYQLVMPQLELVRSHFHHSHFHFHIADLLALIGIGGLVLSVMSLAMIRKPTAPMKDPRLSESLNFENF